MKRKILLSVGIICIFSCDMAFGYVPMICDGRVWEYGGGYRTADERGQVFHYMKFDEHVVVNGKTYTGFGVFNSKYYRYDNDDNTYILSKDVERDGPVWLLREEEGKVYILYSGKDVSSQSALTGLTVETSWPISENLDMSDPEEYGESILYDFSLAEGEKIRLPLWSDVLKPEESYVFEVSYGEELLIGEEECRVQFFNDARDSSTAGSGPKQYGPGSGHSLPCAIEGIGITYNGCLPYYSILLLSGQDYDNSYSPGPESYLRCVMDANGNVLYGTDSPASIPGMQTEDSLNDITYDVLGRRVSSTVPGSVYIRGGKKFVAK